MTLRQRIEPIRSDKIRNSARGEACTLRFFGVCNDDPETTVWCHYQDGTKGMGRKPHDISGLYGCSACHMFLDHGWVNKISRTVLLEHVIDAMQRSQVRLVERSILIVPITLERRSADKPIPKRKPPEERAPIQSRNDWPSGRKIATRNTLQRTP